MSKKKNGVLVVDDSAVVRRTFTNILNAVPDIEVIASVMDPIFAMERMKIRRPDVIVLDVEMPRMDGITFLKKIMQEQPIPVVICSTLTTKGSEASLQALSAGAVDVISKPVVGVKTQLEEASETLIETVRGAASANVKNIVSHQAVNIDVQPKLTADAMLASNVTGLLAESTDKIVAIGTSTGGTQALEVVLSAIPRTAAGMVVVQHMPANFTKSFATRLNSICQIEVREARSGDRVIPGIALIAPGGQHMLLKRVGAHYLVEIKDGPLVSRHRPSVDVLFRSVANCAGSNALGVIMTGMGDDGARGIKEMHDAGARTIAQNEATSIVYGMPGEAVRIGGIDDILPLQSIPRAIVNAFQKDTRSEKHKVDRQNAARIS